MIVLISLTQRMNKLNADQIFVKPYVDARDGGFAILIVPGKTQGALFTFVYIPLHEPDFFRDEIFIILSLIG